LLATVQMIDIRIGILRPELTLRVPAAEDSLPVVRQALRSLGETVQAETEALEDAELALTEALANAVEHAYDAGEGDVLVNFDPREGDMVITVRDRGAGMPREVRRSSGGRGFGLSMIEGIAKRMEIRTVEGTEVEMEFGLGTPDAETVDGAAPGVEPAERILRRLVAVIAAQRDMSSERLMEALLVAELVARNALRYLVGDHVEIGLVDAGEGFELSIGPLEEGGATAMIADTEVPVVGSIVERLVDEVRVQPAGDFERLVIQLQPRG
jgi:serine/threonine-protein kinase RsbW